MCHDLILRRPRCNIHELPKIQIFKAYKPFPKELWPLEMYATCVTYGISGRDIYRHIEIFPNKLKTELKEYIPLTNEVRMLLG